MIRFIPGGGSPPDSAAGEIPGVSGRVLVVDDDRVSRTLHREILARQFDVLTAASGAEALACCEAQMPDLVLLDAEMPELDGYETCRRLRRLTSIPIIFATSHHSLAEQLEAYEAGCNDLVTKPVNREILLLKVTIAIVQHRQAQTLDSEKKAMERIAMGFLGDVRVSGQLLNFTRTALLSQTYEELCRHLLAAIAELGLRGCVQIRHAEGSVALTGEGQPSPLELAILQHAGEMGRIFQFKRCLAVNYERVSLVISNLPDENEAPAQIGQLRDGLVILAEATETLAVNVDSHQRARRQAEQLQVALANGESALQTLADTQRAILVDIRLLLQDMVSNIERTYSWLGTNQEQEAEITAAMGHSVQRILNRLADAGQFDTQFATVMDTLKAERPKNGVELF